MERKMKDYFGSCRNLSPTVWVPAVDIYEDDRHVLIFVDMAGVNPDRVRVTLKNRSILITGERPSPSPPGLVRIHQMEIDAGLFERRIPLPGPVDFDNSHCTCKNGLLSIVLPKMPRRGTIQIPIDSE